YVIGGYDSSSQSTVYYGKLNSDGTIGAWNTTTILPQTLSSQAAVVANGYVYVIGGYDDSWYQSTVYYGKLNSDGTIGAWNTTTILPQRLRRQTAVVANGYVYVIGGYGDSAYQSTVYYGKLNSDGTIGAWNTTTILPQKLINQTSVVANGYVYVIGGFNGSDYLSTVYYTSLARISMAGTLDLVGLTSGSLTDSSGQTGGTIYAGDIFSNNNLEVTGNAQIQGSQSVGNNLSVFGDATFNAGSNAELGAWVTSGASLPAVRSYAQAAVTNGYLYMVGGNDGSANTTVYYSRLNSDGSYNSWSTTTGLPTGLVEHTTVVNNGYIYALGGDNWSSYYSTAYFAKINSDGTMGSWTNSTILPDERSRHSSIIANGYVYVIGGYDGSIVVTTVYYARLASNGSVGSWNTTTLLPLPRDYHTSVVANGYVYVIGGYDGSSSVSSVYYAALNSDGTVGTWNTTTILPKAFYIHTSTVTNGYVYVFGGYTGSSLTSVYYAKINRNGTLDSWYLTKTLPNALYAGSSVVANGYIYVLGGSDDSASRSAVYYSRLPRVSIAADLDLVGITSGSLTNAAGNTGGTIYAGDIHSNNNLEVAGNATIWGSAGISGGLSIQGSSTNTPSPLFNVGTTTGTTLFNILSSGFVGIGVTSPTGLLDVAGGVKIGAGYAGMGTTAPTNGMLVQGNVGIGTTDPTSYKLRVGDTCQATGTNSCVDFAELYESSEPMEPGDVVAIDIEQSPEKFVKKSSQAYQANVIGIVSTSPAIAIEGSSVGFMGGDYTNDPDKPAVALAGRVPVKIATTSAMIQPGDFMSASDIPGRAMRTLRAGTVIGKALETWIPGQDKDTVLTFINLSWFDPSWYLTVEGSLGIKDGYDISYSSQFPSPTPTPIASSSSEASAAAMVLGSDSTQAVFNNLTFQTGTVQLDLSVLGNLSVRGGLTVDGPATFKQDTVFEKLVSFIGDVIFKGKVTFNNPPSFTENTAGVATIPNLAQSTDVVFTQPYDQVPIVVVSLMANDQAKIPSDIQVAVINLSNTGFTVALNKPAPTDLVYNWVAIVALRPSTAPTPIVTPEPIPTATPAPIEPTPSPSPSPEATTTNTPGV
ncbi:MAG: Kelch repeat type 1-containing protein, partial [Microgenomates group bacterium GW2011_GWB1_44_8]